MIPEPTAEDLARDIEEAHENSRYEAAGPWIRRAVHAEALTASQGEIIVRQAKALAAAKADRDKILAESFELRAGLIAERDAAKAEAAEQSAMLDAHREAVKESALVLAAAQQQIDEALQLAEGPSSLRNLVASFCERGAALVVSQQREAGLREACEVARHHVVMERQRGNLGKPQWATLIDLLSAALAASELPHGTPPAESWSPAPPTVPGWYWWRKGEADKPIIREVFDDDGLCVFTQGDDLVIRCTPTANLGGEWSGPLLPPGE